MSKEYLLTLLKNVNTSAILILPLYQKILKTGTYKDTNRNYPFIQCCFDNGFINSYLYKNKSRKISHINLVFEKSKITKKPEWGNIDYTSINEMLISCDYFESLSIFNDLIVYRLKLPERFLGDIKLITQSRYSETSLGYKSQMNLPTTYVKENSSPIGYYLVQNNLSKAVLYKARVIKEILEDFFGDPVDSPELWSEFNLNKETLNQKILYNILNFKKSK